MNVIPNSQATLLPNRALPFHLILPRTLPFTPFSTPLGSLAFLLFPTRPEGADPVAAVPGPGKRAALHS